MIISPFSPIFFNREHRSGGRPSRYEQTFATSDRPLLEVILGANEDVPAIRLYNADTDAEIGTITPQIWEINDETKLAFATLAFGVGHYALAVGDILSRCFRVTDNPRILANTSLIQYSMGTNRNRTDAVFVIDGMQRFFDFRVAGGFTDGNYTFAATCETFTTDKGDLIQLYGMETTQKRFILGDCEGVPVWHAELFNRILSCSYVYIDGERYCRADGAAPEGTQIVEGCDSMTYLQTLQKVRMIDPAIEAENQKLIRRVSGYAPVGTVSRIVTEKLRTI